MDSISVNGIVYRFFNNTYAVSRCGKILRKLVPCLPSLHNLGYHQFGSKVLLHRAVAKCWMDDFEPHKDIHHINRIKTDNRVENLECLTRKEHLADRHVGEFGHYVRTEETRKKIRQNRLGTTMPEETKAKIRASSIGKEHNYPSERKPNPKESNEQRSLHHHRNLACQVFGITYRSFAEASIAINVHRFTVRKRCLSKNFPEYKILTPS
jgi:hypothetical protein